MGESRADLTRREWGPSESVTCGKRAASRRAIMVAMTTDPTIRARVRAGETLFGLFLDLGSPFSAEICARAGL